MILLWLAPPVVVTVATMLWVSWLGREGRGEIDRDEALRRLGAALDDERPLWRRHLPRRTTPGYAVAPVERDRSSGVAVRRSSPQGPSAPGEPERRAS